MGYLNGGDLYSLLRNLGCLDEDVTVGVLKWDILLAVNNLGRDLEFATDGGDGFVYTSEFDTLIGQFVETVRALRGRPSAAKSIIDNLPLVVLKKGDIKEDDNVICAVCKDEVSMEGKVTQLPCKHHYHGKCIIPWLSIHNPCSVCQFEFAYNRTLSATTKRSPFEFVYGINPCLPIDLIPIPKKEILSSEAKEGQAAFLRICEQGKAQIEKSNAKYKERSNRGRKQSTFQVGDLVWLHLRKERFPSKRKSKLMPRAEGSFCVLERYGDSAYILELPDEFGSVRTTFNVGIFFEDENLRANSLKEREYDAGARKNIPSDNLLLLSESAGESSLNIWSINSVFGCTLKPSFVAMTKWTCLVQWYSSVSCVKVQIQCCKTDSMLQAQFQCEVGSVLQPSIFGVQCCRPSSTCFLQLQRTYPSAPVSALTLSVSASASVASEGLVDFSGYFCFRAQLSEPVSVQRVQW